MRDVQLDKWQWNYVIRKQEWPRFLKGEHVIMYGVIGGALHMYRGDPRGIWWVKGETKPQRVISTAEKQKIESSVKKQMMGETYY